MLQAIAILFAHWVGDFLFQTNNMALNKHKSLKWLSIHAVAYSVPIVLCGLVFFSWQFALHYALINGVLHWVTDFFTSRLSSRYKENRRIFFAVIGFDQFIHAACLLGSIELL